MSVYDVNGNPLVQENALYDDAMRLGVHLMPYNKGELNMVKRARQFTDIKWTPAATVKRKNYAEKDVAGGSTVGWQDQFTAGKEYKGVPYSHGYYNGAFRNYAMLGYQVSFEAFATSVQFADSYFCSTDTYDQSASIYTPYGASCDTLGSYAMGIDWHGSDGGFQTLVDNGTIVLKFSAGSMESNIGNVHLGDILWKRAVHVAMITDVVIDENNGKNIEVSEVTTTGGTNPNIVGGLYGGVARRELWPLDRFIEKFGTYNVYRYVNSANVIYVPSPFVTLQGEDKRRNLLNGVPLIPFMGSGFTYLSGHIPNTNVLIGSTAYNYLAVYKDGTLFNTFTINGATSVATNFSANGNYEAFLYNSSDGTIENMTNRSGSCTWSVVS